MLDQESMAALLDAFLGESEDGLREAEEALLALERRPEDAASLASVFRVVHTIKGNSGIFGFESMTRVAHAMEDLLERLRAGHTVVSNGMITLLLEGIDVLRGMLFESDRERPLASREQQLIEHLRRADALHTSPSITANGAAHRVSRTLRIDLAKLDRLLDVSGEINIARGRLSEMLADPSTTLPAALDAQRDAEHLHLEMQELVMKLRMVPVGPVFRQFQRIVRDTAQSLGKEAELRIEGDDVEVDMAVVEHLRDPLMHMVRNSISHGIESAEKRRAAKKPRVGALVLRSFRESGSIVIELSDDGGGIDRDRVLRRAQERGIAGENVLDLIFHPGFSTAEAVTDLSGRGVGLDVVRRNVDAIHGSVSVESEAGRGTTFRVRLPLTLAIVDGLGVGVRGETFVVPMEAVVEVLSLPPNVTHGATGMLTHRGASIPFVRLGERLGREASGGRGHGPRTPFAGLASATHIRNSHGRVAEARPVSGVRGSQPRPPEAPVATIAQRENVVIVRYARGLAALVVDELHGECHTVVKPLPRALRGILGLSGSAILPSGKIAFIIDVPALLQVEIDQEKSCSTN